jgi:secreted trypsin-like serine protease
MTHRPARGSLWAVLAAALVAALLLLATVGGSHSARAATWQDSDRSIVGGTAVPDGKYRFVAALLDTRNGSTAFQQQFCGGTLIDRDSVLTAAHCVFGELPSPLRVTVGRTVLNSDQGQKRAVARIFVHPQYNPFFDQAYDAAVLELGSPVSGIAPIKLATSNQDFLEKPGRNATVAGWGNTNKQSADGSEPDSYANRMREAQVPLVSDTRGKSVYGSSYHANLMVAAGKRGKDTCQGDSGGPMFAKPHGSFTQIGITSFGIGCGAGYPGVYAEVNAPAIRSFIINAASQ